ncbi:MAG TPA: hypothetical protein VFL12_11010 [Thermoanaerobaculia bacterium]|nr:hypothetical protein [Thermoanaerobaculia bacterium]
MKETRAIVAGIVVVVLVALVWGFFRRPAPGMRRVRSFRVQIDGDRDGRRKHVSIRIPGFLVGKVSSLASHAWDENDFAEWDFNGEGDHIRITPRDILDAADRSEPGKPVAVPIREGSDDRLEVSRDGDMVRIQVFDHGRHDVEITTPRALVAGLSQEKALSFRDLLQRIDVLGPGELVTIRSEDGTVKVTAEGR